MEERGCFAEDGIYVEYDEIKAAEADENAPADNGRRQRDLERGKKR